MMKGKADLAKRNKTKIAAVDEHEFFVFADRIIFNFV